MKSNGIGQRCVLKIVCLIIAVSSAVAKYCLHERMDLGNFCGGGNNLILYFGQEGDFYYFKFKGCMKSDFLIGFGNTFGGGTPDIFNALYLQRDGAGKFKLSDIDQYYDSLNKLASQQLLYSKQLVKIVESTPLSVTIPNMYDGANDIDVTIAKSRFIYDENKDYQIQPEPKTIKIKIRYYNFGTFGLANFQNRIQAGILESPVYDVIFPFYNKVVLGQLHSTASTKSFNIYYRLISANTKVNIQMQGFMPSALMMGFGNTFDNKQLIMIRGNSNIEPVGNDQLSAQYATSSGATNSESFIESSAVTVTNNDIECNQAPSTDGDIDINFTITLSDFGLLLNSPFSIIVSYCKNNHFKTFYIYLRLYHEEKLPNTGLVSGSSRYYYSYDGSIFGSFLNRYDQTRYFTWTLLTNFICDGTCLSTGCIGPEPEDCKSCNDPTKVDYGGRCLIAEPQFWNKIVFTDYQDNYFHAYYGFQQDYNYINYPASPVNQPQYIYWKFEGYIPGYFFMAIEIPTTAPPRKFDFYGISSSGFGATAPRPNYLDFYGIDGSNLFFKVEQSDIVEIDTPLLTPIDSNTRYRVAYPKIVRQVNTYSPFDNQITFDAPNCDQQSIPSPACHTTDQTGFTPVIKADQLNFNSIYFQFGAGSTNSDTMTFTDLSTYTKLDTRIYLYQYCDKGCKQVYPPVVLLPRVGDVIQDCIGPQETECINCPKPYYKREIPSPTATASRCVEINTNCHPDCLSCHNQYDSACRECSSPYKVLLKTDIVFVPDEGTQFFYGPCLQKYPVFWNQILLGVYHLYYGFDSSFSYIYLQIIGPNSQKIGLAFSNSVPNGDGLIIERSLTMTNGQYSIDKYADVTYKPDGTGQYDDEDGTNDYRYSVKQQNFYYTNGGINSQNQWEITFARQLNTGDPRTVDPDTILALETPRSLCLVLEDPANPNTFLCYSTTPALPNSYILYQTIICDSSCGLNSCTGPDETDCLTCATNLRLIGQPPTRCLPKIEFNDNCDSSCIECTQVQDSNSCLNCKNPQYILLKGQCISKMPVFWNKFYVSAIDFYLYYGYQKTASPQYIYFRIKGTNPGWVGLLFGSSMTNTDIVVIRQNNTDVLVEDRWSEGRFRPQMDQTVGGKADYIIIQGDRTLDGQWDITFLRKIDTGDNYDKVINFEWDSISMALGRSDELNQHKVFQRDIKFRFLLNQVCFENCKTCVGPEPEDCLTCSENYSPQYSLPGPCIRNNYICNEKCSMCFDLSENSCIQCTNTSLVAFEGTCMKPQPEFWNKIEFPKNSYLLYYGFDSTLTYIYFNLTGPNPNQLPIDLYFGNLQKNTDFVRLYTKFYDNLDPSERRRDFLIEDRTVQDSTLFTSRDENLNGKSNYLLINASFVDSKISYSFMRRLYNIDSLDSQLSDAIRTIILSIGEQVLLPVNQVVEDKPDTVFSYLQICNKTCATCRGPQFNDCLTCQIGYQFKSDGEQPNTCFSQSLICHKSCFGCIGPLEDDCTGCVDKATVNYFGKCVPDSPVFWNQIAQSTLNVTLYYGFDQQFNYIYFRIIAQNPGYIAIGFGDSMVLSDIVVITQDNSGTIQIEDRYSLGHTAPLLDPRNDYVFIKGQQDEQGLWDVYFMRVINSQDNLRDRLLDSQLRPIMFAFGASYLLEKHTNQQVIKNITFSNKVVCSSGCLECYGPQDADCTLKDQASVKSIIISASSQLISIQNIVLALFFSLFLLEI